MDTTQKAPIIVTQPGGQPVTGYTATPTPAGIATIQSLGADNFLVAQAPGSGVLNVVFGAQEGSVPFTVTAAPLTVTLGAPVPKV